MKKLRRFQENKFVSEGNTFKFLPKKEKEDLEPWQILCGLATGSRHPRNEHERKLLEQINEIKSKGHILEIPNEW